MENNYMVISGNEIVDLDLSVTDRKYHGEDDYKKLLEDMQHLFHEVECTGHIEEPQYKNMEEIELKRAEQKLYDNCIWHFMNPINRIEVERLENGLYRPMDRYYKLYTAKKCGMKILVYLR